MKKLLLSLALVLGSASLFAQAIPNGGFESWNAINWSDPTYYFAANDQNVPNGYPATVVSTSGAYHGSFAVQLTTTKVGSDTLQAYLANGNPSGSNVTGGIPYAQKPTGLRIYYKCNIKAGDTGLILAIFKKSGSVIGQYIYKVYGSVGSYTLLAKTFSPALPLTPDTVVFAATPSNLLTGNFSGIPGSTLTIDSLTFTGGVSQPADLNGDFENWTSYTDNIPTGWSGSYPGVIQTVDKYAGSYALELETTPPNVNNNQAQQGYATTGINSNHGTVGGYPYTQMTDTLFFYYKYAPVGTDTASVNMQFKKGGSPIGGAGMNYTTAQAAYTLAKVGFNIGTAPDSVIVSFQSSNYSSNIGAHVGSIFKVDNVYLKSQPLAVNFIVLPEGAVKVYPNPTTGMLNIDTHDLSGTVQSIQVFDMSGRVISSTNYTDLKTGLTTFNMSDCATGLYLLHISTSEGSYFQKINKQ
jgi:hypothetical protein